MLISLHSGFEDLFVFNCRNKRIVRTSVLLAFAAQIRAAASPVEPRADEREHRRAFELLAADGSQVAACVCWGGGIYSLVRFICSLCFPFFSLSQRFSWMLFPRRLCSDKAPPAPRSSCLCMTSRASRRGVPAARGKPAPPAASPGSVALPAPGQVGGKDLEGLAKEVHLQSCSLMVSRCLDWPYFLGNGEDKVRTSDSHCDTQAKGGQGMAMPASGFPCCQRARSTLGGAWPLSKAAGRGGR